MIRVRFDETANEFGKKSQLSHASVISVRYDTIRYGMH